jgi:hypothetical protein
MLGIGEQSWLGFDVILRGDKPVKTGQEEFREEASLSDVKKEMATPRMTKSARRAISQRNRKPNQPMRSGIEVPPKISFDLSGVVTLNKISQQEKPFSLKAISPGHSCTFKGAA